MLWHDVRYTTIVRVSIFRPRQVPLEGNHPRVHRAGPLGLEGNDHEGQRYNVITFVKNQNPISTEVIVGSSYSSKVLGALPTTLRMESVE